MMKSSTIILFLFLSNCSLSQSNDTLKILVKRLSIGENMNSYDHKLFIIQNGHLIKNHKEVSDTIISYQSRNNNNINVMVYKTKKRLFCSGVWNEEGFKSTIYYKKNGEIKSRGIWVEGEYISD